MKAPEPDMNTQQLHGHYQKHTDKTYIGSYDLMQDDGSYRNAEVTIAGVFKRKIYNPGKQQFENRVTATFEKGSKQFIINATNLEAIKNITGTPMIEKWIGAKILLTVETVSVGREKVPAIRVKPPKE